MPAFRHQCSDPQLVAGWRSSRPLHRRGAASAEAHYRSVAALAGKRGGGPLDRIGGGACPYIDSPAYVLTRDPASLCFGRATRTGRL
jgi:hypothetical protein